MEATERDYIDRYSQRPRRRLRGAIHRHRLCCWAPQVRLGHHGERRCSLSLEEIGLRRAGESTATVLQKEKAGRSLARSAATGRSPAPGGETQRGTPALLLPIPTHPTSRRHGLWSHPEKDYRFRPAAQPPVAVAEEETLHPAQLGLLPAEVPENAAVAFRGGDTPPHHRLVWRTGKEREGEEVGNPLPAAPCSDWGHPPFSSPCSSPNYSPFLHRQYNRDPTFLSLYRWPFLSLSTPSPTSPLDPPLFPPLPLLSQ